MTTLEQLEERVRDLERRRHVSAMPVTIAGVHLGDRTVKCDTVSERTSGAGVTVDTLKLIDGHFDGNNCLVVRADKDGDGDFDPYTSTSWDGDSFSTGTGTIDWNAVFGVPAGAKMVCLYLSLRDSSATDGAGGLGIKAKSTTALYALALGSKPSDVWSHTQGWVPVAADGTSYYSITASGTGTCDIYIRVVAYAR